MKKSMQTRCLALATALVLTLSCVASAAFTDQGAITHTKAVNALMELNILQGRQDGSFDPAGSVTRAEMAKLVSAILLGGTSSFEGLSLEEQKDFPDVQGHWAIDSIRLCSANGIATGRADGRFDPDATVTGLEAAKMLLICTGYLPEEAGLTGKDWDKNVRTLAQERGLLKELDQVDLTAPLNRDATAQLVHNALGATMVTYDYILMQVNGVLTSQPTLREGKSGVTLLSVYFPKDS